MNTITRLAAAFGVAAALASCGKSETISETDRMVDELYARMSAEERLAQLRAYYLPQFFNGNGTLNEEKCRELLSNGIGQFSQFALNNRKSADELRDQVAVMQDWLMKNTPSHIPAVFHEEVLSGFDGYDATVYPQQIGLACSFNTALAEQKTAQTAAAMRKVGGFMALSPMVDVCRDPSFNRLEESYGEDSYLSAAMGVAFVKGLQQGGLRSGVAACTKHFLGYGGGGNAPRKELMEEILMPHEAIIRTQGTKALMPGYHAVDGVKCVASSYLLGDILRDYLKFDGIVVSDYGAIEQINDSLPDAARAAAAIGAGCDMDFPEGTSFKSLPQALSQGLVSDAAIEKAVKRVLRLKAEMGLLDPEPELYAQGHIEFDTPDERQTAYQLATQSVVMLKNDGVLPLRTEFSKSLKVALVGPNANEMWAMTGDYSYQAMRFFWKTEIESDLHPKIVGLKEGMENRKPHGMEISYARGCNWTSEVETVVDQSGDPRVAYLAGIQNRMIQPKDEASIGEAIKIASSSDVIVAAMGENAILCGENRDRKHMRLPGQQEEFISKLAATGKPVVLVVFGGRAQVLTNIIGKCSAVIQAWYPGEEGGNALADILYGNVSPSGKLSVSYPSQELSEPICYNTGLEGDSRIAFPFGFGLSYTTFEYSGLHLDSAAQAGGGRFNVSLTVKNTGDIDADEIVQLYISPRDGDANHKPIQLQGFKRVSLAAGQSQEVAFAVSPQQLGYYSGNGWRIDPGRFTVKVGASSADIRLSGEIELKGSGPRIMEFRDTFFAE